MIGIIILAGLVCQRGLAEKSYIDDYISQEAAIEELHLSRHVAAFAPFGQNGTLAITHKLSINSIVDFDTKKQVLIVDTFEVMTWYDTRMRWNLRPVPIITDVTEIVIPAELIWTPDIILYNSARYSKSTNNIPRVNVQKDGLCTYIPLDPQRQARCQVNRTVEVGTHVTCTLMFGSWMYPTSRMDVLPARDKVDLSLFSDLNHEWRLVNTSCWRTSEIHECCPEPYTTIFYEITLERIADY